MSGLFRPQTNTLKDAERITMRGLGIGFLLMALGFVTTIAAGSTGMILILLGGAILLGTMVWMVYISKVNSITRVCPRCRSANSVLAGEAGFRCSACGHFSIPGED